MFGVVFGHVSAVWFPERGWGQQDGKCEGRWFCRNRRWWLTFDRPLVSVVGVGRRLSAPLSVPPPTLANCTNMIRACETELSQLSFPFPLTPTYLKPFPCGFWESLLLCLHLRRASFSRISQLHRPQLLRFHCPRMSWQRCIMTGLENQMLASLTQQSALILTLP